MENRRLCRRIILSILMLLSLMNLIFFVLSSYSGPVIGMIMAAGAAIHWWRKKDALFILIIGSMWLFIHFFEIVVLGKSSYPILLYLNVVFSIPLLYCGVKIYFSKKKR
jgi:hypothetical protein